MTRPASPPGIGRRAPRPPGRRGAALPIVLLVLLALVPAIFVFSHLSRVETVRVRNSQQALAALSLAEEAVQLARESLQSGAPSRSLSGDRPEGRFDVFLYAASTARPERQLYYAIARGESGEAVRLLSTTLEVVAPPRLASRVVIPHDAHVFYVDREISTASGARELIQERAALLERRVARLARERSFSDAQIDARLESMKSLIGSPELVERWPDFKAAMLAGRSKPPEPS